MYTYRDVSAATSKDVGGFRVVKRKGIVLHETIGINSLYWLQGGSALAGRPASADFLIDRKGDVFQLTQPGRFAFHTGVARWQLQQDPDRSLSQSFIGIELENHPDNGQKVTTEQYIACAWLIRRLISYHPIDIRNIVGHYQVALPAGRKSDPLTLNWAMLTQELINPSVEADSLYAGEVLP